MWMRRVHRIRRTVIDALLLPGDGGTPNPPLGWPFRAVAPSGIAPFFKDAHISRTFGSNFSVAKWSATVSARRIRSTDPSQRSSSSWGRSLPL